jgi:hypothetical protein
MTISEILRQHRFEYKDKPYKVIKAVKMKSVVTNVWFDAIEYVADYPQEFCSNDSWFGSFVRPLEDFASKFKPIEQQWKKEYECEFKPSIEVTCRFKACGKTFTPRKDPKHYMTYCIHCGNKQ